MIKGKLNNRTLKVSNSFLVGKDTLPLGKKDIGLNIENNLILYLYVKNGDTYDQRKVIQVKIYGVDGKGTLNLIEYKDIVISKEEIEKEVSTTFTSQMSFLKVMNNLKEEDKVWITKNNYSNY